MTKKIEPLISFIVVNYNGRNLLEECLNSVMELNYPQDKIEIVAVDNCSCDNSVDFLKNNFPKVKIIKNSINNYCIANNLGIKGSNGEFVALINNDLKLDKEWLANIIETMKQDKKIGVAVGKVLFSDGIIQGTGHYELPNFYWSDRGFKEENKGQYDQTEEMPSISHCAALYRRKCLDNVGPLDEDFMMYMEDVDLSIRLRQKGWRLLYIPQSISFHKFHGSIDEKSVNFYCERNRLFLVAKHYPHKLAEAIFGSGYFTVLNKRSDLLKILPDALAKLIKHHSKETLLSLLPTIFAEVEKILNLEKDYLIKHVNILENNYSSLLNKVIPEKEKAILEKDRQLEQLLRQKEEAVLQKDRVLLEKEKETEIVLKKKEEQEVFLNGTIRQNEETIRQLLEKDRQLEQLLRQKEEAILQKDKIICQKEQKIEDIFNSGVYRLVVRPIIWPCISFLRSTGNMLKNLWVLKLAYNTRGKKKQLCLAEFSAKNTIASYLKENDYFIKVVNKDFEDMESRLIIDIWPYHNGVHPNRHFAYFVIKINLKARSSAAIRMRYDWKDKIVFYEEDEAREIIDHWKGSLENPELYVITALLRNQQGEESDKLVIMQRLKQ